MNNYRFNLDGQEDLIYVDIIVDGHQLRFILDTGATNSVIDINVLLMLGYPTTSSPHSSEVLFLETANGVVEASSTVIRSFKALGLTHTDFPILTYDFIAGGITSYYDGMLGLDFFKNTILSLDFRNNQITLTYN